MDLPLVPLSVPGESEKTVLRLNGLPFPEPPDDRVVLVLVQHLEAAQRLVRPVAEAVERMGARVIREADDARPGGGGALAVHAGLDVQHGDAVGVTVAVDGQGLQIAAPGVPDVGLAVADEVVLAQGAEGAVGDDEVQAGDQKEKRSQPQDHNVEFGGLEFFHPDSSLKDNSFL